MVGRRINVFWHLLAVALILSGACTTPSTSLPDQSPEADQPSQPPLQPVLDRAQDAVALGRYADALELYAEAALVGGQSELGQLAASELRGLVAGLSLEPGAEWLAADGTQITGSTREVVSTGEPVPSVLATISEGPARVAVHGLVLEFTYEIAGSVVETVQLRTSEYGTAAAPIPTGLTVASDLSVSIRPIVSTAQGIYELDLAPLEFNYVGTVAVFGAASVFVLGARADVAPDVADVMVPRLRASGTVAAMGPLDPGDAVALARGNPEVLSEVTRALDCALLAVSVVDVQDIAQVEYLGQVYDIWKTDAVVRFNLYDPAGPRTVMSISSGVINGQGGSESDAIADTIRAAAAELDGLLRLHATELRAIALGHEQ